MRHCCDYDGRITRGLIMNSQQGSKIRRRNSGIAAVLATCTMLGATAAVAAADDNSVGPIAITHSGEVRGAVEDGINVFKGIPYGAPTGGANRFMPPREPKAWR